MTLAKLHQPEGLRHKENRLMRYSDTDLNGHVNNTRYADFACDAVEEECMAEGTFLSEMQIGYLAECRPGEELRLLTGREGDVCFAQGMDESGKSRFEELLAPYIEKPQGKPTLVRSSDKRPEWNTAKNDFMEEM